MAIPEQFASPLLPALGLMSAAIALAWYFRAALKKLVRRIGSVHDCDVAERHNSASVADPLGLAQLRLHRLEDDLEVPLQEQMQMLDQLIRLGDHEIARLRSNLAQNLRQTPTPAQIGRQPDLILVSDSDRRQAAEAFGERRRKRAA
ncbi:MAG TPA: hypothetical protein VL475_09445 [Planctomycetaceae bacterium]|jgi:hypothetical protein|nr:hypothetical protein [Planctomycetaceae bacterium]